MTKYSLSPLFKNSDEQIFLICPDKFIIHDCNTAALLSTKKSQEELNDLSVDEFFTINLNKKDKIINEIDEVGIYSVIDKASKKVITLSRINQDSKKLLLLRAQANKSTKSAEKARTILLDENVAGYFRLDIKDRILECNNSIALQLGYGSKNQIINRNFSDLLKANEVFIELKKQLAKQKQLKNKELRLISKKGNELIYLCNLLLEKDDAGNNSAISLTIVDISERVRYENQTKESEERFKLLSNVAIEGIVFLDKNIIIDCNEQFVELLGFTSRLSVIEKSITEFISEPELEKVYANRNSVYQKKNEVIAKKEDGSIMLLEVSAGRINHNNREADVLLLYEITQRKKIEIALEQSTERYKSLVENSPNGIFILVDNKIKFVNNTVVALLEADTEDDLYNQEFLEFVHTDFKYDIEKDLFSAREGEEIDYKEVTVVSAKGKEISAGLQATLTVYGNKPACQITLVDLTAQIQLREIRIRNKITEETNAVLTEEIEQHKMTQEKLQAAQKFARNIIESSIDMIIAVNKEGKITEFNKAAVRQFGYSVKEIIGQDVKILYNSNKDYDKVRASIKSKNIFTGEITNRKKDGETFVALLSSSIIEDQKGGTQGSMGVSRDITDRKLIEQQIKNSLKEKEVLLQEVHHRVKNNLQVISSILSLQSNYVKDEKTLEILGESQNRIKSMSYIHETLYQTTDFSSVEFSNYLDTLAKSLIHSYSYSTGPITLIPQYEEIYLTIDQAIPCGLIVNELVSNALKYAFKDGDNGKITLSIKESKNKIMLRVADNGIGLPKDFKYEESDSLGMQLVYSLIDQLDAKLELKTNKGTDFLITFERS